MNEVKLLLRDTIRLCLVARINPISARVALTRGRIWMCSKIYLFDSTHTYRDLQDCMDSRQPQLRLTSFRQQVSPCSVDTLEARSTKTTGEKKAAHSVMPSAQMSVSTSLLVSSSSDYSGKSDHHQINSPCSHMTIKKKKKEGWQRLKEQLTDDSISIFSDIVRGQTGGMEQRVLVCNSEREGDGIELKQEHRIHASA